MFLWATDLHECSLAWLGHPHVALPGYPALVLKLPHRQVNCFIFRVINLLQQFFSANELVSLLDR